MTASEIMTILIHFLALNQHLSGFLILTMHLAGRIAWAASIKNDTVIFLVNLMCGLIAYGHQPRKPGLVRVTDELIAA